MALAIFGSLFMLAGFACFVAIWIEMFKDEMWKGLVGILCFFYTICYVIAESESDHKWLLLAGIIVLPGIGAVIAGLGAKR